MFKFAVQFSASNEHSKHDKNQSKKQYSLLQEAQEMLRKWETVDEETFVLLMHIQN